MRAREVIHKLQLMPHPEGGHYREVFPSELTYGELLPRSEGTTSGRLMLIYFLLESPDFSPFRRLRGSEIWAHLLGGPIEVHSLTQRGEYSRTAIGRDFGSGAPSWIELPGQSLLALSLTRRSEWALGTCLMRSDYDFSDFSRLSREELLLCYPNRTEVIRSLTRPV